MLAPAGNRIQLGLQTRELPCFEDYDLAWCQSGTAALAIAINVAKKLKQTQSPEVIIPGYACPDLVSACAYTDTKCKLCDLELNNTSLSLEHVKASINENTIAIIAINFLGIQEQLPELKAIADKNKITLIEDNAQWFPDENNRKELVGDCVSISFGRGKPVSMLGGGLVLIRQGLTNDTDLRDQLKKYQTNFCSSNQIAFFTKSILYNLLINPILYGMLTRVPGLNLGETKYKPLNSIEPFEKIKRRLLGENIHHYLNLEPTAQLYLQTHLDNGSDVVHSLPNKYLDRTKRLLRFPVLFEDQALRDHKFNELNKSGLGASKLYNCILPEIDGTAAYLCDHDDLPNAYDFSRRLITLPVHSLVKQRHLDKMIEILNV